MSGNHKIHSEYFRRCLFVCLSDAVMKLQVCSFNENEGRVRTSVWSEQGLQKYGARSEEGAMLPPSPHYAPGTIQSSNHSRLNTKTLQVVEVNMEAEHKDGCGPSMGAGSTGRKWGRGQWPSTLRCGQLGVAAGVIPSQDGF